MALGVTYLGRFSSTGGHGAGAFTTTSMSPQANSMLVAAVSAIGETGSENPSANLTFADSLTHTWTARASGTQSAFPSLVRIYTAPNTPTTSFTITVDCGANSIHAYFVDVWSITGASTTIGATASGSNQAATGAVSGTLSGTPASTSYVFAALIQVLNSSGFTGVTFGTGWTEVADTAEDAWMGMQTQTRTGSTSTTVAWDEVYNGSGSADGSAFAAAEIVESSATNVTITPSLGSVPVTGRTPGLGFGINMPDVP